MALIHTRSKNPAVLLLQLLDMRFARSEQVGPQGATTGPMTMITCRIRTTRIAGGLLLGYNPWKAGARLKTPAFTLFKPYCP